MVVALPGLPNDPTYGPPVPPQPVYGPPAPAPVYGPPAPTGGGFFGGVRSTIASLRPTAAVGTAAANYTGGGPWAQQLDYRRRLLDSGRGVIDLGNPYNANNTADYNAQQGVYGAQAGQNAASRGVLAATGPYNAAQRAVTAADIGNTQARIGENANLVTAQNDVADQSAVAQYQEYLAGRDRRSSLFGVAPEQRITIRPGQSFNLPSGQVAAGHANADYVQEANQRADTSRGLLTDLLRGSAAMAGHDVSDARLKEGYAGADVADARLNQSRVGTETSRSDAQTKYDDALLRNEASMADLPPFPGAVQDDFTGEWITRQEQEQRRYDHAQQLDAQLYPETQARNQQRQEQVAREQTQRQTGGSPWAALPDAAVLNQIESFNPDSFTAVRAELVRRAMGPPRYFNQQQAETYADNAIAAEMSSRQRVPTESASGYPSGGGGGYTTIN